MITEPATARGSDAPTIFIVDDDESQRRALARLLKSRSWKVESFDSAEKFLGRDPYEGIGCVLLDVTMPGLTGPQAHAELLARGFQLPVIFLTGHGDLGTGIAAMKRGALDFLSKPVDEELLLQALQQALDLHVGQQLERQRLRVIRNRLARLSPRELEVFRLVISGLLNKQIADRMGISIKTVKVHRAHLMKKMEADSVATLVRQGEIALLTPVKP